MKELYELREHLCDMLKEYGRKDISSGTLDVIDKLAHSVKNLDKIIGEDGYSGHYPYDMHRGSYKRDSMGRYSLDYSRADIKDKLRDLMDDAGDERVREEIKHLIDKM